MSTEPIIMSICPSCGEVGFGWEDDECQACKCSVISTGVTWDEYVSWDSDKVEAWKKEMAEKFAPNATKEAKIRSILHYNTPSSVLVKCPVCGDYARPTTNLEAAYAPSIHHSKTVGKSFICENCGYAW